MNRILISLVMTALITSQADCRALDHYLELEPAVRDALADAEALAPGFEAGGAIYQCGRIFAYTSPVTQYRKRNVDVEVIEVAECPLVAMYHTHPRGISRFSPDDIRTTCARKTVSFIKPEGGAIRVFDCRDLSVHAQEAAIQGAPLSRGVAL